MKHLQIFVLVFSITLFGITRSNAQAKSPDFIEELTERDAELNRSQRLKLSKLRSNKSFDEVGIVKIGNLKALEKRGALPIKIPGVNGALVAHRTNLEALSEDEFQWTGEFENVEGEVFINATKDGVFGRIIYLDQVYNIEDIGDGKSLLFKYNNDVFTPEECGLVDIAENGFLKDEVKRRLKHHCTSMPIRVGVMFTQNAQNTGLNINNIAQTGVNDLNTIITNSGLTSHDARFLLAGVQRLNGFNETANDACGDAVRIRTNNDVANFRQNVLADVIILLTDGNYGGTIGCVGTVAAIGGNAGNAFAVVQADEANARFSFGHEIIHLVGGRHQQCNVFLNGGCDDTPGFEHGWNYRTGWWLFGKEKTTVMHQLRNGWTRQRELSNPAIHGRVNLNDNARMIEDNACDVSNYFPNPLSGSISGPTILNAYQTGTWTVNVQNCNGTTNIIWEYSFNGWSYSFGGTGSSFSFNILSNQRMYIRVSITCSDGQTITLFRTIYQDNNYYIASNDEKETKLKSKEVIGFDNNLQSRDIKVYPNPAITELNIEFETVKNTRYTVSLIDDVGKVVLQRDVKAIVSGKHNMRISIPHNTSIMNYVIISDGKKIISQKVIIHENRP